MEEVILVSMDDEPIGVMEKMEAHRTGRLHRAFSIFIFNNKGEMMLQQRAHEKYHSGGLWTNACCSHPRPNETVLEAANRRLIEEMGFSTELKQLFSFTYHAGLDNNLIEHELDHVIVGTYDDTPIINPDEVADWKFVAMEELANDLKSNPDNYTVWFRTVFNQVQDHLTTE
jgi:isopentenyl-diphosphate delta-isomerase